MPLSFAVSLLTQRFPCASQAIPDTWCQQCCTPEKKAQGVPGLGAIPGKNCLIRVARVGSYSLTPVLGFWKCVVNTLPFGPTEASCVLTFPGGVWYIGVNQGFAGGITGASPETVGTP